MPDQRPQLEVVQQDRGAGNSFVELGTTGLKRASGYVHEEFLPQLQGENAVKIYREMADNDPIIGGFLFAIDQYLRKVVWRVDPADDSEKAQEMADYVRDCMEDMSHSWEDFISEVLSMLVFGWAYFEVVYKRRVGPEEEDPTKKSKHDDNKIGWRKFAIRSQDSKQRWIFDEDGGIKGMVQLGPPDYKLTFVPIEKALLFRTSTRKNNPEGRSILRNSYRPWYFKRRIEEVEGVGIERDLAGLPVAFVPAEYLSGNATPEMKATVDGMTKLVKNVRRDEQEGVIFPLAYDESGNEMFRFALLNSGGTRMFNTGEVIERYDRRIAIPVLADFILLGNDAVGSYALSITKSGMFQAALEAWLDSIASVINQHAVTRLFKLNGFDYDLLPNITHEPVQAPTIEELGAFIAALAGSGMSLFPDITLENALRARAGLPEREEDEEDAKDREQQIREQNEQSQIDVLMANRAKPQSLQQAGAGTGQPPKSQSQNAPTPPRTQGAQQ